MRFSKLIFFGSLLIFSLNGFAFLQSEDEPTSASADAEAGADQDKSSKDTASDKLKAKNTLLQDKTSDKERAEAIRRLVPNLAKLRAELDALEKEHGIDLGGDPADDDKDEKLKYHWKMSYEDGWTLGLDFGIITDWDANHSITGVESGNHFKIGGKFEFIATLGKGPHEWRNNVGFVETFTKTPTIDSIIKSRDDFEIDTMYLWWPADWVGLSAEFRMDTSVFPGYDIEERPSNYFIVDQFGNPIRSVLNVTSLNVNTWFLPLHFKQILTGHVRPIKIPEFAMEIKAGGYIIETIAEDMLHFVKKTGDDITLQRLTNFVHFGPYIGLDIFGKLKNFLNIDYHLSADFGYASFNTHTVSLEPKFTDDLHFEGELDITINPFKSIALTVDLEAHYQPSKSKDLQFTHKIFINLPVEL